MSPFEKLAVITAIFFIVAALLIYRLHHPQMW